MSQQEPAAPFGGARRAASYVEQPQSPNAEAAPPDPVNEIASIETEPATPADPVGEVSLDPAAIAAEFGSSTVAETAPKATKGFRGALNRIGLNLAPAPAEQRERDAAEAIARYEETIRQATWTRAVSILVANKKGGAGKTPTSLILGGILAAVRGGAVAVVEVSDDPGALTYRAEGTPTLGLGQLVTEYGNVKSQGQLAGYTAPQTSFASVIGTVGHRPPLSHEDVRGVAALIDEYYSIRVMDSGNQTSSAAFQAAAATADAVVIPLFNAGDAATDAVATLDAIRATGEHGQKLANNAVALRLSDGRPEHPQVVERIGRLLEATGLKAAYSVPFDRHIAERGQITLSRLAPHTRTAFTEAAAAVVRSLHQNVTTL